MEVRDASEHLAICHACFAGRMLAPLGQVKGIRSEATVMILDVVNHSAGECTATSRGSKGTSRPNRRWAPLAFTTFRRQPFVPIVNPSLLDIQKHSARTLDARNAHKRRSFHRLQLT